MKSPTKDLQKKLGYRAFLYTIVFDIASFFLYVLLANYIAFGSRDIGVLVVFFWLYLITLVMVLISVHFVYKKSEHKALYIPTGIFLAHNVVIIIFASLAVLLFQENL